MSAHGDFFVLDLVDQRQKIVLTLPEENILEVLTAIR
jgi:hypothetical protein